MCLASVCARVWLCACMVGVLRERREFGWWVGDLHVVVWVLVLFQIDINVLRIIWCVYIYVCVFVWAEMCTVID